MSLEMVRNYSLEEVSETGLISLMHEYDDKARQKSELELEYYLLERFGLFDPKNPGKSKINQIIEEQDLAKDTLGCLLTTGKYPKIIVEQLLNQTISNIEEKRRRILTYKEIWRNIKLITKTYAIVGNLNEEGTYLAIFGPILATFGVWAIADRALADPEERTLAQATAAAIITQRQFLEPIERKPLTNIDTVFGRTIASKQDTRWVSEGIAKEWEDYINERLDYGVSPHTMLETLDRQSFHQPLRRSVKSAEDKIITGIRNKLDLLPIEESFPKWDSYEALANRKRIRQDIAISIVGNK